MDLLRREKTWAFVFLLTVMGIGCYARFSGLAWHFSHVDDIGVAKTILDRKLTGFGNPFMDVAKYWTYAPFQFFFTPFLLHPEQTYREILCWGRLPSAVAACAGLFALYFFYLFFKKGPERWRLAVFASALMAFSWANLIYAKQMHNYALGVTAFTLMLVVFVYCRRSGSFSFLQMTGVGAVLALLGSMQYQILFSVPAFFLALWAAAMRGARDKWRVVRNFIAGGASFGLLFYPVWHFFLRRHQDAGVSWNRGLENEFLFALPGGASWLEGAAYTGNFFLQNSLAAFQANMAFLPPDHVLYTPVVYYLLGTLFLAGAVSFFDTRDEAKKYLGMFFAFTAMTWAGLVLSQRLTLSPTRHLLILAPAMAVITGEGLAYIFEKLEHWKEKKAFPFFRVGGPYLLAGLLTVLFLSSFHVFLQQRKDPFVESRVVEVLRKYDVEGLMRVGYTVQPTLMKGVKDHFRDYEFGWLAHGFTGYRSRPFHTLAWISHRTPLSESAFELARNGINTYLLFRNQLEAAAAGGAIMLLERPLKDYEVIYEEEIHSNVEMDYSNLTRNGSNSFYFYVLRLREE